MITLSSCVMDTYLYLIYLQIYCIFHLQSFYHIYKLYNPVLVVHTSKMSCACVCVCVWLALLLHSYLAKPACLKEQSQHNTSHHFVLRVGLM